MASRPQSWVNDYENVDFDLAFTDTTPSGRESPHERQHMLADEATQPARSAYMVNSMPMASSPTFDSRDRNSPPYSTSNGMPQYPSQELPMVHSHGPGPEAGPSRMPLPRSASYKSVTSSRLNPAFPSGSPPPHVFSPFARPGSHGSAHITRIPSEESRALSLAGSPFGTNSTGSRGSMILYRRADTMEEPLLPPSLPHANRSSVLSSSGDSFVSSDSKYPSGMMAPVRGLIAYAYDPSMDQDGPVDEVDALHDPDEKIVKVKGRPMSWRGFKNLAMLVLLLVALLSLFVAYPVFAFFHNDGRNALIVGNTRINSTGQAVSVSFDQRSQMPIMSLHGVIDPVTPKDALTRRSRDGVFYDLVFSDEFNTDGRIFSKDDDAVWEVVNHYLYDPRLTTTRGGYLTMQSHAMGSDSLGLERYASDVLRQRGLFCLQEGYMEISTVMPSGPTRQTFWVGTWSQGDEDEAVTTVPEGASLSRTSSLQLCIGLGNHSNDSLPLWHTSGPFQMLVDYVRFYQKAGGPARSCDDNNVRHRRLDFFAGRL